MKNLTIIGLRLLAIWILLRALSYVQFLPAYLTNQYEDFGATGIGMLIVLLIYLVATLILFVKAPAVAAKISGDVEDTAFEISSYEKLTAILFATVGLLIFFGAFETFINSVGAIYNERAIDPQKPNRLLAEIRILLFGGGIQMVVGLGLFIGGKKIANWWYNFRNWT